ncbi:MULTISPECIES: phage terminase small subunit P27 family [Acetobacterales]|uniref:phage terminase small subunit P27 family n=1 Tax=Roseomonas sp. WGS1072 TaxID=3366816 RepID=UPI003BF082E8
MKGRKPKLAVVMGDAAPSGCPGAPSWLAPHAAAEWNRAAPELHQRRLLARDTLATLENYAVAVGTVRECEETMQRDGRIIETEKGPTAHPAFRIQAAAMREARLLATELGLTPHRRGKHEEAPKADPWEGMLA